FNRQLACRPHAQRTALRRHDAVAHREIYFRAPRNKLEYGAPRRCGEMVDATDLKLQFWRFRRFALLIKSCAVYLCKSLEFANFSCFSDGEQKAAHSCTNSCTEAQRTKTPLGSRNQTLGELPYQPFPALFNQCL